MDRLNIRTDNKHPHVSQIWFKQFISKENGLGKAKMRHKPYPKRVSQICLTNGLRYTHSTSHSATKSEDSSGTD